MQRYFIQDALQNDTRITTIIDDFHHIKNVMRFKVGDEIIICDPFGHCYISAIQSFNQQTVICSILSPVVNNNLPVQVDIAQALIRRERFEYMIQKSTELGVHTIIPIVTKHTIIKVQDQKEQQKQKRWNLIAKEASEQSHRSSTSNVTDVVDLKQLPFQQYEVVLVAYEKETNSYELRRALTEKPASILVVIGPEGGFDESEIDYLSTIQNVRFVGLGKRILRSETASGYVLSVVSFVYEMGDV